MRETLRSIGPLLALVLAVSLSFWFSPPPQGQPGVEYWGHYVQAGPGLGFVVNHDSYAYLAVAEHPGRLLQAREERQSRPLYALLGAAVGYPLTGALDAAGRLGLAPRWWPEDLRFYGFYSGFVLLNAAALLASLLLLRRWWRRVAGAAAEGWQFWALAWALAANPVTKAFFWTAHQQMLAFLVPLCCLTLATWAEPPVGRGRWLGLNLALGLLPLAYGSFVLAWPALAWAAWRRLRATGGAGAAALLGRLLAGAALFALPTLLWVALLRWRGVGYYNHEAERFHQLVWLWEGRHLPPAAYAQAFAGKLADYAGSLETMWGWLLGAAVLGAASAGRAGKPGGSLRSPAPGALAFVAGCFVLFFALLGYYPPRLAFTLLPLVLALGAGLLPRWPRRWARPLALGVAAGWHLYVLLSYGPFS